MNRFVTISLLALVSLAGCGRSGPPEDARKAADIVSGDSKGSASDNPVCRLFSEAEASAFIGEAVEAGGNAAMGQGCQWAAKDGDGEVTVAIVPADYEERASSAQGFREVPAAGKDGFVVPDMGGWVAGAVAGKSFYRVTVAGSKASDSSALALLGETIKRKPS
ncbi:MAG: lipoprotein [Allosphingosinicella sp.]